METGAEQMTEIGRSAAKTFKCFKIDALNKLGHSRRGFQLYSRPLDGLNTPGRRLITKYSSNLSKTTVLEINSIILAF